jgi:hypothetical protein
MRGTFSMTGVHLSDLNYAVSNGEAQAASAKSKAMSLARDVKVLRANLAKSMMITEALWEILRDEHGMTDEKLHKKIYEIDMRDGILDSQNQRKAEKCPECDRMVSSRHPACLYCGTVMDTSAFTIE